MPSLIGLLAACFQGQREVPGDQHNAKLAELLNAALQEQIRMMNPTWSPSLLPQAADNARQWLGEIDEVVARCRFGPRDHSRRNVMVYDILLRSGEVIENIYSGRRCQYEFEPPLVMRVRFDQGRIIQSMTDGRELKRSIEAVRGEINLFARNVIQVDQQRRYSLYFPLGKTSEQNRQEWQTKP